MLNSSFISGFVSQLTGYSLFLFCLDIYLVVGGYGLLGYLRGSLRYEASAMKSSKSSLAVLCGI